MTGAELVWLEGVSRLHTKMDKVMSDLPSTITEAMLRAAGKELAVCGTELNRLGPASARLRPVRVLAGNACAQYEAAAKCFTAAKDCGFDKLSTASRLFVQAEIEGENIKEAAG